MTRLAVVDNPFDFTSMHTAIQKYVDDNLLAGASAVVLKDKCSLFHTSSLIV